MGVPQNRWFIVEHPIRKDDLGVPPFQETSIWVKETLDTTKQLIHGVPKYGSDRFWPPYSIIKLLPNLPKEDYRNI